MRTIFRSWIGPALALLFTATVACAQDRVPFRQQELDQMLAPVALYPDSLLSQVLMASTYPLEIVQAARWSRANPGLKGQDAARAVEHMDWDPSVKSLAAFPEVLQMMDEKLEWTERLGEAFLAQQGDVMDSVQALRRRAEDAGNLQSNEHMRVERQGEAIVIEPPAPQVVYVPHYSPAVVYGPWLWPAYPPVFWAPPAYYAVPAYSPVFAWGPGIAISAGFFFGHADWHHRHVTVVNKHVTNVTVNRTSVRRTAWRHDPAHRRGVPFRNPEARQRIAQSRAEAGARDGRDDARASRRGEIDRLADIRQRRFDERRGTVRERSTGAAAERAGGASRVDRAVPAGGSDRAGRAAGGRSDETVRAAGQRESNKSPPHVRDSTNAARPRPESRNQRVERSSDRRGDASRLQSGRRADARGNRRQTAQSFTPQASALAPRRAAAGTSHRAPRMENRAHRGNPGARSNGNGAGRARAAGRNNGRGT
jgi:hypothetical protein